MNRKQAIEHAINMGYEGLVYRGDTDALTALGWLCGRQIRIVVWARGEWFAD